MHAVTDVAVARVEAAERFVQTEGLGTNLWRTDVVGQALDLKRTLVDAMPPAVGVDVARAHSQVDRAKGGIFDSEIAIREADRGACDLPGARVVPHLMGGGTEEFVVLVYTVVVDLNAFFHHAIAVGAFFDKTLDHVVVELHRHPVMEKTVHALFGDTDAGRFGFANCSNAPGAVSRALPLVGADVVGFAGDLDRAGVGAGLCEARVLHRRAVEALFDRLGLFERRL